MKRKAVFLAACSMLGAAVFGSVAAAEEDPFKVGFVMLESTGNSYNQLLAMQEKCEERGWELVYDSADNDSERTISLVQNFITQECDAIYVYTVDSGTQLTAQNMCEQAGVHVAFTGLMEENCIEICDNEAAQGAAGAEVLQEAAKEKWGEDFKADFIICTEATEVGDGNRIRMHENFIPKLCEANGYDEADVVWIDCGLDLLTATSEAANVLSAHPDAEHILIAAFHDSAGGQGPMNALKAAGREDDALILSYHISDEASAAGIRDEECWYGSFYFPAESYIDPLFEAMDTWSEGGEVENGFIYSECVLVTKDNIDEFEFAFAK
ncbi:MAG: substrate-binding domain-containing protein [Eubacteriales bacterium]|nr:substrate-binding domain-containing protein [Eubacteriales bacterium]